MSPASKSKSKDKSSRAAKEQAKVSSKPSLAPASTGNGVPASAYNPLSGTFHMLDTAASGTLPAAQHNGRFRTIDETEENSGSSFGTTGEFDSASNNDSCSGESEDPKEKISASTAARLEPVPGCDTDKREKIRQKNEKKHQRQKERRAQELHERCSGYLMSRKLEALAQQLVAMGFSSEQATMALIQNEGRLEESVTWLFEGGEESKQKVSTKSIEGSVNLKIDISDELAKISEMEMKYKCTKQEVERAIVTCEGDLEKAEETLRTHKQEQDAPPQKLEEPGDPVPPSSFINKIAIPAQTLVLRNQPKGMVTVGIQQQRRDEQDIAYPKLVANGTMSQESNRSMQSSKKIQSRPQVAVPVDKRWSSASSTPSISYPLPTSLQVPAPATKSEARYGLANNEGKTNLQAGMLREPIIVMQRPQSVNAKQNPPSTSLSMNASPPTSTGWYSNGMSNMEMLKVANGGLGHGMPNLGFNGSSAQQFAPQNRFQPFVPSSVESGANGWGGTWKPTVPTSPSLSAPPSIGLLSGWGSSGSASSPVDWSNVGSGPIDYTSIDWSLDTKLLTLLRPSGKNDRLSNNTWSTMFMGGKAVGPVVNGGGVFLAGLQDSSLATDPSSTGGSHEWTSPFTGKDLFRVPRQFVTSPSL